MFATMLFTIAIVALFQFALYYWRAVLTGVASQRISRTVLEAAHLEDGVSGADFDRLVSLHELTPELDGSGGGLWLVGAYYSATHKIEEWFGQISPAIASWSEREMAICARYAAVQVDRRMQANLAEGASMRAC